MANIKTVYAVKHKDENIRAGSRSGGFFTAVSDVVLENGGAIYGCVLNENFLAEHRRAVTKEERDLFRGSKYIQSDMNNCYALCADDLNDGSQVLFSGTPCQIEGLNNFLNLKKADTSNLVTIDIICHGVPSPKVWSDFLKQEFPQKNIQSVRFRDKKKFGWREHIETVVVDGVEFSSKTFKDLFYSHYILRPSCFECNYKNLHRQSDITIGDYWKIEDNDKDFDDDKGVSFVKLNTEKGEKFFNACSEQLIIRKLPLKTSIQPALDHNYKKPDERKNFWVDYKTLSVSEISEKYIKPQNKSR